MKIRIWSCALAFAACVLLTACSHPQLMDQGMTEVQVETRLGAPHAVVDVGNGMQRWVYSMQPFGQEVWWLEFDADGRLLRREEVLDRAHMAMIKPGESTKRDVWNIFGKCAQEYVNKMVSSRRGIEHRRPSMQNLTTCKQKKHSLLNLAFGREYHGI